MVVRCVDHPPGLGLDGVTDGAYRLVDGGWLSKYADCPILMENLVWVELVHGGVSIIRLWLRHFFPHYFYKPYSEINKNVYGMLCFFVLNVAKASCFPACSVDCIP